MSPVDIVQGDLFSGFAAIDGTAGDAGGDRLPMPDAEVRLFRHFFNLDESDRLFQALRQEINWRQDRMTIYGKDVDLPRKTAWYGDPGKAYTFSGIHLEPKPWTSALLEVKTRIEAVAPVTFNSVLLNLYRDGKDSISWHTDAEYALGKNPVIGSVSFGGTRRVMFRHRQDHTLKNSVELTHGSFLLMAGKTQHCWHHQIPKTAKMVSPRISLTFRVVKN